MLNKIIPAIVMLIIPTQAIAKPIALACDTSHESQSNYQKEMVNCNPGDSSHLASMTLDPSVNNSVGKLRIKACWATEESTWIGKITVGPQIIVFTPSNPSSKYSSSDFIIDRATLRAGWSDPMRGFQCKVVETVINNKI